MRKVFINNFDNKKKYLLLIIIYNNINIFNKFYRNIKKKINLNLFNVVLLNNNFPLSNQNDNKHYEIISNENNYTYININKNIGFLNSFIYIEKLFSLHNKNKHMFLFNCEMDSFIETKITNEHLLEIEKKIQNDCSYLFINNEYWQKIALEKQNESFIKMIEYDKNKNMTHVQCFFHHPYKTKELDKKLRYSVAKKTISDMIKENDNIYLANNYKQNFFIYNKIIENIHFLKRKVTFEYFFYKRLQYYYYKDKSMNYNHFTKFEVFLKIKKTCFLKKKFIYFIFVKNHEINENEIHFKNKDILFFVIKKLLKDIIKFSAIYQKEERRKKINQFTNIIYNRIIKKYKIFSLLMIKKTVNKFLKINGDLRINKKKNIKII